ncbi:MAG: hypothetical protein KAS94_01060 [Desulfobulbaceae bacterium]|nr:hypothetical protein [Desulfobulbaceae bacterium]
MNNENQDGDSLEKLITDIKTFIKLSLDSEEKSIQHWIDEVSDPVESFCYSRMQCNETGCLAYKSECGRCWLQAGTMCGGQIQGKFADKYELCTDCKVYKEYVGNDPVRNLRELVITLVHSLNLRRTELKEALAEVNTLRGLIPICSSCKRIRDDQGTWNRIESYIAKHSEAEFTHSYCNDCIRKLYPDLADEMIAELAAKAK